MTSHHMKGLFVLKIFACIVGAMGAGLLLVSCGGDGSGTSVKVGEAEWKITPEVSQVKQGKITFNVTNSGTEPHEFLVIKTDLAPSALPVEDNEVNEDKVEVAANVEPFPVGQTAKVTAKLSPGTYVLICNVKEGGVGSVPFVSHYQKGMWTAFTVTQ